MKFPALKNLIKKLSNVGLDINYSLDSGISIFGINISVARHQFASQSQVALQYCLEKDFSSVLDVGSGGAFHAREFGKKGAFVTCIDFGTSIYAIKKVAHDRIKIVNTDFTAWNPSDKYDLVWASHVLEHQRNVGSFIEKLIECCHPNGVIAITVPYPHRRLWGGHLTLWTPGLLAYNIVMCGIDLSESKIFYGYREISIIFTPKRITLPELTYDSGDITKISAFLPCGFGENLDSWQS